MTGWFKRAVTTTPGQAKKTLDQIVKEEVDDKRKDELAPRRQQRNGGRKR